MHYLSIEKITSQQMAVWAQTRSSLPGFFDYTAKALDTLIKLLYAAPRHREVSPERDEFIGQSIHWFYSAVFTFNAAIHLMELGYYLEAQVLYRMLIEVFVKLRYFHIHPEHMDRLQRLATGERERLQWRTMFDAVLPQFYDEYSRLAYEAHGGIGANTYRLSREKDKREFVMGLQYSEFWATAFVNQITPLMLGYLRVFLKIFGCDWISDGLKQEYDSSAARLESAILDHIRKYGRNDWHDRIESVWKG